VDLDLVGPLLRVLRQRAARRRAGAPVAEHLGGPTRIHWGFLVGTRFLCGDYEGCVAAAVLADDVIPNLPAWKAAALHHLGTDAEAVAEARRFVALMQANWFGAAPPTDAAIARWFLHLFPINRFADWERLRQGIAGAGLPVDEIESI
jgi:hypothetical protein